MPVDVSVIVLRYNGSEQQLRSCVESVVADAGSSGLVVDMLLVDNASTVEPSLVDLVAADHSPLVRAVHLDRNHGFAGGVNRGIGQTEGELLLLLNDDAVLMPGALIESVRVLRAAAPEVVAAALKMLLASDPFVIDGVGIAVNGRGEAFNRGLGQPDVGQFDVSDECLGPCFGAALIRRMAFGPEAVGLLDESFFLYYEDVEWSWRATLMGFRTLTAPGAVVRHDMSASSRSVPNGSDTNGSDTNGYAFKHRFIERNLLASVAHCFEARRALAIWARRWPALVKGRITGEFPAASGGAAWDALRGLPLTLRTRRAIQARRRCRDVRVIAFSTGENTFFDPVRYLPIRRWEALAEAARRRVRQVSGGDQTSWLRLATLCDARASGKTVEPEESRELTELAAGLHPGLIEYLANASAMDR